MSELTINGSALGNGLQSLLMADDIQPGAEPSYQLCKTIYLYHPLGKKMADKPISIAMSQKREITIPKSPEQMVLEAFEREWEAIGADNHIANVMSLARVYGEASIAYGAEGVDPGTAIDPKDLAALSLYFSVFDPLNTAGSLVLNQDPNSPDYQKHKGIAVSGTKYNRSRSCTVFNEKPIYISYTASAFGFVGRSVYQRALYPLKTFIQSMVTDDMVTRKAGLLVAKLKPAGSIVDKMMQGLANVKRNMLKQAQTDNVLSISTDEEITTLDMTNTDTAMTTARKNALENIASAADMPAHMINNETFAEGFGEGTEDAKANAQYVDGVRKDMQPLYTFFDNIVQYRAWNPEFYEIVRAEFPDEYGSIDYQVAFYRWRNSFKAKWPSLLIEPESERSKSEKVKMDAIIEMVETLGPMLDPENKATLIKWAADNFNEMKLLFSSLLELDYEALAAYVPPDPMGGMGAGDDQDEPKKKPAPGLKVAK